MKSLLNELKEILSLGRYGKGQDNDEILELIEKKVKGLKEELNRTGSLEEEDIDKIMGEFE